LQQSQLEKEQHQHSDYVDSLLNKDFPQPVVSLESQQAAFDESKNAKVTSAGNDLQELLARDSSEHPPRILEISPSTLLLRGQAARRPMLLAVNNAKATETRTTLKVLPGGQDKERGREKSLLNSRDFTAQNDDGADEISTGLTGGQ
jgi:hypothetical protein